MIVSELSKNILHKKATYIVSRSSIFGKEVIPFPSPNSFIRAENKRRKIKNIRKQLESLKSSTTIFN